MTRSARPARTCDAPGCSVPVPRGKLMCRDRWFATPHPLRARPNSPALLPITVRGLAAAGGHDLDELCAAVQATGRRVFGVAVR